ncbi:MAG: hypothetical protein QXJ59_01860 [Thermofilaceae archaeon]
MSMLEVYLGSETLRRIRAKVEGAVSPYNSPPPPQGVLVLGCDGSLARMLRTDADGRPQVVVVSLPNPPNLDVALSTRASESTLSSILGRLDVALSTRASESTLAAVRDRLPSSLTTAGNLRTAIMEDAVGLARDSTLAAVRDRLPSSLTSAGNLRTAIVEDAVGLARDSTVSSILNRLDVNLSTRASESTLAAVRDRLPSSLTTAGNFRAAVVEDTVGLARDSTVAAVRDRLPSSLTTAGNFRVAVAEDAVGLARDSTLAAVRDRLPSSLTTAGNLKVAILEDAVGIARDSTLSSILGMLDVALSTRASESTLAAVRDRLPSSLTTAGNLKTAIMEDAVGLARDSTVAAVRDRLPSSLTSAGNLRVAVMEDAAGLSRPPSLTSPADAETYTTTPLAASAAYYGPTRDFSASRLAAMGVMGYADQPSAMDGVYIQLSIDGSNWDYRGATTTLPAAGAVSLCQIVTARYARAVWVNGATAQTAFRFGGRYMIAGSENPPLSPVVDYPEEAVCSVCGTDRTEAGDFFAEKDPETDRWIVYCPKCYANKRWKEVTDTKPWLRGLKAWAKTAEEKDRIKAHTPDAVETEVV